MHDIEGKVAVVTGAASGIGLALVTRFAAEGMKVVLADIEGPALDEATASLPDGVASLALRCDVSDLAQVEAVRDAAVAEFGTVHVVCNNAGVASGGLLWEQTPDDWRWVLGVNLGGVINGVHAFTPLLVEQGEGHIVNTASMAGLTSPPMMGPYNVSKHAVVALSETLFGDLAMVGSEVGVSVLCPGWVNTRINEAARNRLVPDAPEAAPEPDERGAAMQEILGELLKAGLDPSEVAEVVLDAIRQKRFYVLTHPDWKPMIASRVERILAEENPVLALIPDQPTGE